MKKTLYLFILLVTANVALGRGFADNFERPRDKEFIEKMQNNPWMKEHFGLQLGVMQHPMYLIVDEDRGEPIVGERTLPWGAPNAEVYCERINRNLQALEKFDDLYLNYQFSAVELDSIRRDFPQLFEKMQELHKKGRLDFVDGTFSQPHLQSLSSESNWRQFEYGKDFFKKYFDKDIKIYMRQECGLTPQLPQLLKKFDYSIMSSSAMNWFVEFIEGPFEIMPSSEGMSFINGSEFFNAVALDGSELPFYAGMPTFPIEPLHRRTLENALMRDLYRHPPIWIFTPDMVEMDADDYEEIKKWYYFVLIEQALKERIKKVPPKAKARIFSYWSYNEGTWAEELLRAIRKAESTVLLAESIQSMAKLKGLAIDKTSQLQDIWYTILKYQHHDVSWQEVTDLRQQGIDNCNKTVEKSNELMNVLSKELIEEDENYVAVFNSRPFKRNAFIVCTDKEDIPAGEVKFQEFDGKFFGYRQLPAGGFKSFRKSLENISPSKEKSIPKSITTQYYSIDLEGGLIKQITSKSGKQLLDSTQYLGGEIRALINDKWEDNRQAQCRFFEGSQCFILERRTGLADIPVVEKYFFFKHTNNIKVQVTFNFNGNQVGNFWIDETKINIYYPTANKNEFYHDVPFGYMKGKENKPVLATSWISSGSLTFIHYGTVKNWVKNGVIANVVAWGGTSFSNRHQLFWDMETEYDIKLYGKKIIEYDLIVDDDFDINRVVQQAADLTTPIFITTGKGENSFYKIDDTSLNITCVFLKDGQSWMRGYQLPLKNKGKYQDFEIFNARITK
jgi:hypothetical protein